ncbi:hypothetical protein ACIOG3_03845 [Yersinia rochesterensis]|uniref:Uncharacterized protein n=1 Tax=Yersinia pekkanenii TaxID=1288385 RepID=A0A0T9RLY6_9GAMM|nr:MULTISPECIES: hypothetical protein [Yersinia]AIN18515.1 putative membrane protein [Yersinia rochesterensis]CNI70912.1 Uncharacterised protein [Yersinia pekkanenii]CRY69737.1 Uncharacterised protein [Yersinia pekkanenii]
MTYTTAWIISYVAALITAVYMISKRTARMADELRFQGADDKMVDQLYKEMAIPSFFAILQATIITGTLFGAVSSALIYFT